jgi:hypothetical protein
MNYLVLYRAGFHGIVRRWYVVVVSYNVVTELVGYQPDDPNKFQSEPKSFRVELRWSRLDLRFVLGTPMLCRDGLRVLMA